MSSLFGHPDDCARMGKGLVIFLTLGIALAVGMMFWGWNSKNQTRNHIRTSVGSTDKVSLHTATTPHLDADGNGVMDRALCADGDCYNFYVIYLNADGTPIGVELFPQITKRDGA